MRLVEQEQEEEAGEVNGGGGEEREEEGEEQEEPTTATPPQVDKPSGTTVPDIICRIRCWFYILVGVLRFMQCFGSWFKSGQFIRIRIQEGKNDSQK